MIETPLDAVVFDCDGTLSPLEGIVELARWRGVEAEVSQLTEKAMSVTGMTPKIYQQRLEKVRPSYADCVKLAHRYYDTRTTGIDTVLTTLQEQGIATFILSAGVNPSVSFFADRLKVTQAFAVDLHFSPSGEYRDYNHHSPMTQGGGKRQIVSLIQQDYSHIAYIGDGQNDLEVSDQVDCFIGYGGAYYRPNIERACQHYIREPSLLPLLQILGIPAHTQS